MKRSLILLLTILAWSCIMSIPATRAVETDTEMETEGPYEDIQGLLASAAASANGLASLDTPGPPRVIDIHHQHTHVITPDTPVHVAERIAEDNTPPPPKVRIIQVPNRAQAARHAAEDAQHLADISQPTVTSVDVKHTVNIVAPQSYTIKGQRGDSKEDKAWEVRGSGYHFPLVDRSLKRPTFPVIAETDGSDRAAGWKPHTPAELQAEAMKLLERAKKIQQARNERDALKAKQRKEDQALGLFDEKDNGFEDELTRLKRVSARMNRLREQIERPRNTDSFEASIARKKYFLKLYRQLKRDATEIIEAYALRTGNSIFQLFGDGKIDPSIAAFLPPNSVAGILAQYANPTRSREDETPRDVISGTDAKRIQYSIDHYNAIKEGKEPPMPPKMAMTDEELRLHKKHNNPLLNKVVATQDGEFGQGRPAISFGNQAIGRSSVHVSVVNPTETQHVRGLPVQVNLKLRKAK